LAARNAATVAPEVSGGKPQTAVAAALFVEQEEEKILARRKPTGTQKPRIDGRVPSLTTFARDADPLWIVVLLRLEILLAFVFMDLAIF
jgi:hypothetical protein